MQRLRLPAGAVLALRDLADAREGEVFRIEALTARDGAFDERDPCRRSKLTVAIKGNFPGRPANRHQVAVHRIVYPAWGMPDKTFGASLQYRASIRYADAEAEDLEDGD